MSASIVILKMPQAAARDSMAVAAELSGSASRAAGAEAIIGVWPNGDVKVAKERGELQIEIVESWRSRYCGR